MSPSKECGYQKVSLFVTFILFGISIISSTGFFYCFILLKQTNWEFVVLTGIFLVSLLSVLYFWLRFLKEVMYIIDKENKNNYDSAMWNVIRNRLDSINQSIEGLKTQPSTHTTQTNTPVGQQPTTAVNGNGQQQTK